MRHIIALTLMVIGFGGIAALSFVDIVQASGEEARLLVIEDAITPIEAKRLSGVLEDAKSDNAKLLIIQLSTPGGLLESTRSIVEDIFASPVPVIVYVSPPGAHAASAGTFIVASAHIAAMAPATNIGAASPVSAAGEDLPDTIKAKATQDAAAFIRSIAVQRNRNADALQDTVISATSYSADEAVELQIVDLKAENLDELLEQLNGIRVHIDGQEIELDTSDIVLTQLDRTPVQHFMRFLSNPNIAFLLLTIGGIGILIELFTPGLMGPGAVGVIAIALAFLAFDSLPVNWIGVGLIILAMALFYFEAQAPGIGVFGITGALSFIVGAFLLFGNINFSPDVADLPNAPTFTISVWVIVSISALIFASMILTIRAVREARRVPEYYNYSQSNPNNLIGESGIATTDLNPAGSVRIAGEQWSAVSNDGEHVPRGESVMIVEVDGLILKVEGESNISGQMEQ